MPRPSGHCCVRTRRPGDDSESPIPAASRSQAAASTSSASTTKGDMYSLRRYIRDRAYELGVPSV